MAILREDQHTFLIISRWSLLTMRNFRLNFRLNFGLNFGLNLYRKHISCSINVFFRKPRHLWDNVEKYCKTGQATYDNTTWRMRIARWIPKATNTHLEYEILIAFPLQQWLHERAPKLPQSYPVPSLPAIFSTTKPMPVLKPLSYLLHG
jgi:hypothetical protein